MAGMDQIDANQSLRAHEDTERTLRREAALEEQVLKSVNDQIGAVMAKVYATTIKDLAKKMTRMEAKIGQQ